MNIPERIYNMFGEKGLDYTERAEKLSKEKGTDNVLVFIDDVIDQKGSFSPQEIIKEAKIKYGDNTEETSLVIEVLFPYLSVSDLDSIYISLVNQFRQNQNEKEIKFSRRRLLKDMREAAVSFMLMLMITMQNENN